MKTSFTTTDIVKGLKIPFGRLREWIVRGYVKPSVPAAGPGKAAQFTINDVYSIQIFKTMVEGGFAREAAARVLSVATGGSFFFVRRERGAVMATKIGASASRDIGRVVIDLTTGNLFASSAKNQNQDFLVSSHNRWTDIYILNAQEIREQVDAMMKGS